MDMNWCELKQILHHIIEFIRNRYKTIHVFFVTFSNILRPNWLYSRSRLAPSDKFHMKSTWYNGCKDRLAAISMPLKKNGFSTIITTRASSSAISNGVVRIKNYIDQFRSLYSSEKCVRRLTVYKFFCSFFYNCTSFIDYNCLLQCMLSSYSSSKILL